MQTGGALKRANYKLMSTMARIVTHWLSGMEDVAEARPVFVRIGNELFAGTRYKSIHKCGGDTRTQERIYCLGQLPVGYRTRSRRAKYVTPDDTRPWYMQGYYQAGGHDLAGKQYVYYHPFGHWFSLALWEDKPGSLPDYIENKGLTGLDYDEHFHRYGPRKATEMMVYEPDSRLSITTQQGLTRGEIEGLFLAAGYHPQKAAQIAQDYGESEGQISHD